MDNRHRFYAASLHHTQPPPVQMPAFAVQHGDVYACSLIADEEVKNSNDRLKLYRQLADTFS